MDLNLPRYLTALYEANQQPYMRWLYVSDPRSHGSFVVELQGVLVLAATNRPQAIDAALMRPGRFDSVSTVTVPEKLMGIPLQDEVILLSELETWLQVLYVPPPDKESRLEILRVHTRRNTLADDVDLEIVADSTEYFTGAELAGLCREAVMAALRESLGNSSSSNVVCRRHFDSARNGTRASLSPLQIASYADFKAKRWI
jgi:SpoVK/Ycf46/Vps4 family AAA+-type ATPase